MTQDTNVQNLIINKLTKVQYESIETPDPTQLYFITDDAEGGTWGSITGTLSNQTDLQNVLDAKQATSNLVTAISSLSTDAQYPSAKCVLQGI